MGSHATHHFIVTPSVGMGDLKLGDPETRITELLGDPLFKMGDHLYQYMGFVVVAKENKVYSFQCGGPNPDNDHANDHAKQCPCRTMLGIGMRELQGHIFNYQLKVHQTVASSSMLYYLG